MTRNKFICIILFIILIIILFFYIRGPNLYGSLCPDYFNLTQSIPGLFMEYNISLIRSHVDYSFPSPRACVYVL